MTVMNGDVSGEPIDAFSTQILQALGLPNAIQEKATTAVKIVKSSAPPKKDDGEGNIPAIKADLRKELGPI
jgi:hypothetical protein